MIQLKKSVNSSVGRKWIMALSGLALVGFVVVHLLGNLTLYSRDGSHFNAYAAKLDSFGIWLTVAEVGLVVVFGLHILSAILLKTGHRSARPVGYKMWRSKSAAAAESNAVTHKDEVLPSNSSSRNMIVSGLILLGFLILHLWQFRFGAGMEEGYVAQVGGQKVDDLHRLVVEAFNKPLYVGIYVFAMAFLGFHLRHGFWSAFQSLGVNNQHSSFALKTLGILIALALAAGFLFIPIWIYFGGVAP